MRGFKSRAVAVASVIAGLATSCGGSDRVEFWMVASTTPTQEANCPGDSAPTTTITTDALTGGTWELWREAEGKAILAYPGFQAIPCTWAGSGLTCASTTTQTSTDPTLTPPTTWHNVSFTTIAAKVDGDTMSGTWITGTSARCEGSCSGPPDWACTYDSTFTAFREPATLVHQL